MEGIQVGCVPLHWGQFRRAEPEAYPQERILREVREAGFEGISAGPSRDKTPQEMIEYYASFGLKPAPGYLGGDFWKDDELPGLLESAKRQSAFANAVGLDTLFVAPSGGGYVSRASGPSGGRTRNQLAGHVGPDDGLSDDEMQALATALNRIGATTKAEGVLTCIHNHVGQVIETRAEMDRLFALVDRDLVFVGLDTGHLAWAGDDVTQFVRDYKDAIKTMHLKDIDETVRRRGHDAAWDYNTFTANGIFVELGEGKVDFPEIFRILTEEAGFRGWVLSETDVTQKPSPLQSARESREYLQSIGI